MSIQTSLLILPPLKVQAFAAPFREKYSPVSFAQGPAHITLFYPFVAPEQIDSAEEILARRCKSFAPITVTLDRYARFETAHLLVPSNPEPIVLLHKHLFEVFPDFPPYEGKFGPDLLPHLTLATFDTPDEADQLQLPSPPSFEFIVEKLHLYLGSSDERIPWIPVSVIPLG